MGKRLCFGLLGFAAIALAAFVALLVYDRSLVIVWVGAVDLEIEFVITNAEDGQPVKAATIAVDTIEDKTKEPFRLITDQDGVARRNVPDCSVTGRLSRLGFTDTYAVNLPFWVVQVSASGYEREQLSLHSPENTTRVKRVEPGHTKLVIPVALQKKGERN